MSNLFRNNYKVYLYKYNYKALQNKVESILNENSTNKFLFESFVTNLYTIGIPSDEVVKENIIKKYKKYIEDFKTKKPNISNSNKKVVENTGDSRTVEYKPINEDYAYLIKHERATISRDNNLLQEALAQNYALQKLQQEYEDDLVKDSSAKINWMSTMSPRQTYDTYITNALNASKILLDKIFEPVIDELAAIQSGGLRNSEYVYVIDLTDLTNFKYIDKVETERTKYSDDDFIRTTANKILEQDLGSNAVDSIGAISTTLEGLSNMTSFNLRQDVLLQHGITIEANDVIEIVDTNLNNILNNENYVEQKLKDETQFIGFVTKVSLSQRFHETSLLNVTCEGISKMLSLNPTINSNAVASQFKSVSGFISGDDKTQATSSANVVNVFSTFFDGLNAYDLFVKLLSDTLAVTPVEEDKAAYTMRLISDPKKLKTLPYQYSKPLLVLYHFAVTYSTLRKINYNGTHIILARLDNNVNQEKLQAYLLMLRSQFDLFWSNMTTPISVLQTLANNTFLEVFEDRNGILILRPPRYNTWIEGDVINEQNFIEWTQSIDDSSLKSRSDYQWSIPALGVQNDFCGGYYQDIPALLKYGFRVESPKSSPSVQSEIDAAVYSALDVTKSNSNTRTFELTVPLTQEYKLGRLYYFPEEQSKNGVLSSKGFVGYLTNITTTIAPGNVDTHRLVFKYMRAAECLQVNTDDKLVGGMTTILNFKRLPELAIYQDTVTEDMLTTTQQKNIKDKARRLVSSNRYYWASYNNPNKIKFDKAMNSNIPIPLSESEYKKLYKTMNPTNILIGDFKTLNDIKSSEYSPSQQLINSIWCADILSRTGYKIGDFNISNTVAEVDIPTRQLRTRDNETNLLAYLNKDKTIKNIEKLTYIDGGQLDASKEMMRSVAPYATVNFNINDCNTKKSIGAFLILDSLIPNIQTEFAKNYNNYLNTYMQNVMTAYKLYNGNSTFHTWYRDQTISDNPLVQISWISSKSIDTFKSYDIVTQQLLSIQLCIDSYNAYINNVYQFDKFMNAFDATKICMDKLLEYYDMKNNNAVLQTLKDVFKYVPGVSLASKLMDILNRNTSVRDSLFNTKIGIPAYLVNTSQLPAVHTWKGTNNAYVAGVCSVDYTNYIKVLNIKIKDALLNGHINLDNTQILNASCESIGTIKKLIFDPNLSDEFNLYFYPVIELNNDNQLQQVYVGQSNLNLRLKSAYMFDENEIRYFINNNKSENEKKLACIVRVTPTHIPETKIPTIQQIYKQDGLYVGYEYDKTNKQGKAVSSKAIFDPSVLFKWTTSEIEQLYTVNIYNFIELCSGETTSALGTYLSCTSKTNNGKNLNINLRDIPWKTMIKTNNRWKLPSVSNTTLNINILKISEMSDEIKNSIRDYLKNLSVKDLYEINNCNETNVKTGYMYIKDLNTKDTQLALTFDWVAQISHVSSSSESAKISDDKTSSYSKEYNSIVNNAFLESILNKEYAQVGLYDWGPYMPYDTEDLYPNNCILGSTK